MPQITIDLSDEAYALLQNRARDEALSLEAETTLMVERSLAMTLPEGIARWNEFRTAVTSIKGFIATLRMDEDGTMFEHSDRLEFYEIIERECDRLRESIEVISLQKIQNDRYHVQPTSLRAVLEAVRDRALTSPSCKQDHQFILEYGAELPDTFLTDEHALTETLSAFIEEVMVCTPDGREIWLQILGTKASEVTFVISHPGQGISPQFAHWLTARISYISFPEPIFGRPGFLKSRAFLRWHGGSCEVTSSDSDGETKLSFRLSPATESDFPLWDDMPYRLVLAKLRRLCIRLLAGAEQVATKHAQFDHEARTVIAKTIQTECNALTALAQSLSRSDIPAAGA